jgi:RNA polymerase sigma factor (sigma-70 family)
MDSLNKLMRGTLIRLGNLASLSDGHLLERFVASGEQAAFEELVRRHGPMVLRTCQRVLHHAQDAEDAFQATFIVLARKAGTVVKNEALPGWLHSVAFRVAVRAKGRISSRQAHEQPSVGNALAESRHGLVATATAADLRAILDEELNRLPEKYRTALVLCYLQGKTNAEAAGQVQCGVEAIETRLTRGRRLLHRQLTRRGVALTPAALVAVLGNQAMAAAIPSGLIRSTVQGALTSASASALISSEALATAVLGDMGRRRLVCWTLLLAIAGLGMGGVALAWWNTATPPEKWNTATPPVEVERHGEFDQLTIVGAGNSTAGATNAVYNAKTTSSPAFFQGFHYTGGPRVQFNSYSPTVTYPFTVRIVESTATYQQVYLTTKGDMWNLCGDQVTGGPFPVKLDIFITITSKAASTAGYKVATMSFKAFDATGQQIFDTGLMTGQWK